MKQDKNAMRVGNLNLKGLILRWQRSNNNSSYVPCSIFKTQYLHPTLALYGYSILVSAVFAELALFNK